MPIPHWYKEQRERQQVVAVNNLLLTGLPWLGLLLVALIVVRSRS